MRILLLFFSIALSLLLTLSGLNQWQEARNEKLKIVDIEERINLVKQGQVKLQSYKTSAAAQLPSVFKEFHNFVKLVAEFHQSEAALNIPGYKDQQNIDQYFSQSELPGVNKLNLKVSFNKLKDSLSYVSILSAFYDAAKNVSFEIISITSKTDCLEIVVNLYGV